MFKRYNMDKEYVRAMKLINDSMWKGRERWLYYSRLNQNYIIPTIVACCLCFFLKGGFIIDLFIIDYALWLCRRNNRELDKSVNVIIKRIDMRLYRRTVMKMNV